MSVGLLRVLAQQKLISKEQFESYEAAANSENGKDVISSVIGDKIIDAMGLAELFSNLFGLTLKINPSYLGLPHSGYGYLAGTQSSSIIIQSTYL